MVYPLLEGKAPACHFYYVICSERYRGALPTLPPPWCAPLILYVYKGILGLRIRLIYTRIRIYVKLKNESGSSWPKIHETGSSRKMFNILYLNGGLDVAGDPVEGDPQPLAHLAVCRRVRVPK